MATVRMTHHLARCLLAIAVLSWLACAHTGPHQGSLPDPLRAGLFALPRPGVEVVSLSPEPSGELTLQVSPQRWSALFTLLRTLRPSPNVVLRLSEESAAEYEVIGQIHVLGPPTTSGQTICPVPSFSYTISLCTQVSTGRIIAFVSGSRESTLAPYEGEALLHWYMGVLRVGA